MPSVQESGRGVVLNPPELMGVLFGAGTAIRLVSAPIAGRIADRTMPFV
jgi:hypothetical protein